MNRYMAFILILTSICMVLLCLAPNTRGEESGWYEIRGGQVRNLSGPMVILKVGSGGNGTYNITGDVSGIVRVFDSNVVIQGNKTTVEIKGTLDIWAGANNVSVRNLIFRGNTSNLRAAACTGLKVTDCIFVEDAYFYPSGCSEFVFWNNALIGQDYFLQGTPSSSTRTGIWVAMCGFGKKPSLIYDNDLKGFKRGIYLQSSYGTIVYRNRIEDNLEEGVYSFGSGASVICGNNITGNGGDGILLSKSPENIIAGNVIGGDPQAPEDLLFRNGDSGIEISDMYSANNSVWNNVIWGNPGGGYGIRLRAFSHNNTVVNNNFMGDGRHEYCPESQSIFHAGYQHLDLPEVQMDVIDAWAQRYLLWDPVLDDMLAATGSSPPIEDILTGLSWVRAGNFWEGHCTADTMSGPNQDQAGSDGICDVGYNSANVTDRYPLVDPYEFNPPGDHDGVPDWIEALAPGLSTAPGDGNGDSVSDSSQPEVASLYLHESAQVQGFLTLNVSAPGELLNVRTYPAPGDPPLWEGEPEEFPYGMFGFVVLNVVPAGSDVDITVWVPGNMTIERLWKKNTTEQWDQVPFSSKDYLGMRRISFTLEEGGPFDHDRAANGILVDDAGLAAIPEFAGASFAFALIWLAKSASSLEKAYCGGRGEPRQKAGQG